MLYIDRDIFPVLFMQHVTAEGTALVKQAEDAASNKKVSILISLSSFVDKLISLISLLTYWINMQPLSYDFWLSPIKD